MEICNHGKCKDKTQLNIYDYLAFIINLVYESSFIKEI